jgi:hypothetical protein
MLIPNCLQNLGTHFVIIQYLLAVLWRNKLLDKLAVIQSVKILPFILSKLVHVMVVLAEISTILLEVSASLGLSKQMYPERGHG